MIYRPNCENVRISGRTTDVDGVLYLGFSGAYVEFETMADRISVIFRTDSEKNRECDNQLGWVAIWVDGKRSTLQELSQKGAQLKPYQVKDMEVDPLVEEAVFADRFCLRDENEEHQIVIGAPGESKKVRIVKTSESAFGLVGICSIEVDDAYEIHPTAGSSRKIEFIGDSITCGYGNEGLLGEDIFTTGTENPLDAYAVLTAEKVAADYQLVSWSGIGIITNYVDPDVNITRKEILMPWLYPCHDLRLEERLYSWPGPIRSLIDDKTPHDFKEQPDLIVINIGTNDDSYVRTIKDREDDFAIAYEHFIHFVHTKNPGSAILCCLGLMGRNLCAREEEIVKAYAARHPEIPMRYVAFPEHTEADVIATDCHPSKVTHKKASDLLASEIRQMLNW